MNDPLCKNVPAGGKSGLKAGLDVDVETMSIHDFYDANDLVVMSGMMTATKHKSGEWKKTFGFRKGWEKTIKHDYNQRVNGYALLTGKTNGITAIDIDDPTLEHNIKLMDMMKDCSMIAKTRKGFHYLFRYTPLIKGVSCDDLALDTRNDNNCVFCEPTRCVAEDGSIVATYEWIKRPNTMNDLVDIPQNVMDYLLALSPKYFHQPQQKQEETQEPDDDNMSVHTTNPVSVDDEDKAVLHKLAQYITNNKDYSDWINNGFICYNEGLPLSVWEEMSRKCAGYEEGACAEKWRSFSTQREKKLTQATWWKWLKTNNPITYKELQEERNDLIEKIKLINHNDIAKLFWNIHPNAYAYNNTTGWYVLNKNNIWDLCDDKQPEKLKNHIADTFQDLLTETLEAILNKYARICKTLIGKQDELEKKEKEKRDIVKLINKAYVMCGSSEFCNGVVQFLREKYNIDRLEDMMGTNPYLFAFDDGMCFDLNQLKARPIVPTDYVSLTTGYRMPKQVDMGTRNQINEFLYSLFEDNLVQDYLMKILATCLFGGNRFEEFYVFTGSGGNGKSAISDMLLNAFGSYYYSVNATLFTRAMDRVDQPIPALVEARNKRIMMTSECENDEELREVLLKKIVGNDLIEARTLFNKHIIRYKATYKPIILVNIIPKIKHLTDAMVRRMRIVNFPFKFRSVVSASNERLADPDIKEKYCKSQEWRDEFILMLWETYQTIANDKSLPQPSAVREATNDYFDTNNPLKFWLDEHFEITKKDSDRISASELFAMYKEDTHDTKMSANQFASDLAFNKITKKKSGREYYCGLVRKPREGVFEE